jgi:hypothetical protein
MVRTTSHLSGRSVERGSKEGALGSANVEGDYADIYALEWVSHLRAALAGIALKLGMEDIDLSSLERAEPRQLTQRAGRIAFELGFAGVFYHSRYCHSIDNWAIFGDWTNGKDAAQNVSLYISQTRGKSLETIRIWWRL